LACAQSGEDQQSASADLENSLPIVQDALVAVLDVLDGGITLAPIHDSQCEETQEAPEIEAEFEQMEGDSDVDEEHDGEELEEEEVEGEGLEHDKEPFAGCQAARASKGQLRVVEEATGPRLQVQYSFLAKLIKEEEGDETVDVGIADSFREANVEDILRCLRTAAWTVVGACFFLSDYQGLAGDDDVLVSVRVLFSPLTRRWVRVWRALVKEVQELPENADTRAFLDSLTELKANVHFSCVALRAGDAGASELGQRCALEMERSSAVSFNAMRKVVLAAEKEGVWTGLLYLGVTAAEGLNEAAAPAPFRAVELLWSLEGMRASRKEMILEVSARTHEQHASEVGIAFAFADVIKIVGGVDTLLQALVDDYISACSMLELSVQRFGIGDLVEYLDELASSETKAARRLQLYSAVCLLLTTESERYEDLRRSFNELFGALQLLDFNPCQVRRILSVSATEPSIERTID
jgi:hypothetical protein